MKEFMCIRYLNKIIPITLLSLFIIQTSCTSLFIPERDEVLIVNNLLVDSLATTETLNLFTNLKSFTIDKTLFGHQETTAYGVGWTHYGNDTDSDIKKICGDYPAVFGWDIGNIGRRTNNDCIPFDAMKRLIIDAFERGGINTISSHMNNPYTGKTCNDVKPSISYILPGGSHHEKFIEKLDLIADFIK